MFYGFSKETRVKIIKKGLNVAALGKHCIHRLNYIMFIPKNEGNFLYRKKMGTVCWLIKNETYGIYDNRQFSNNNIINMLFYYFICGLNINYNSVAYIWNLELILQQVELNRAYMTVPSMEMSAWIR